MSGAETPTRCIFHAIAVALELMTHRETPWIEARDDLPSGAISAAPISKDSMKDYYRSLIDED
jgi:uncharacterized phage-associated protein